MTVIGTILLCFGMGLCAHLVERKTDERVFERVSLQDTQTSTRMYWIQPGDQSIGDQIFDAFAYSDQKFPLQRYVTSWKKTEQESYNMAWIWTAVVTTALGFVCQFLGLRACHSSVAVAQFGATVLMSLVRASLRTQRLRVDNNLLKNDPDFFQGNELDILALNIGKSFTSISSRTEKGRLGPLWVVVNTSPPSGCDTTAGVNPDIADAASGPNMDEASEFDVLERLSIVSSGLPNLCGFRINSKLRHGSSWRECDVMEGVDKDLSMWKLSEYRIEHDSICYHPLLNNDCKHGLNAAVTAMFYRSRLARMTGSEQSKSEHSSYWGERFVPIRETAIKLALAIEDTMQILFDLDSEEPVNLSQPWEQALRIFWTLRCSLQDHSQIRDRYGGIHMLLQRAMDGNGAPKGPWKADRSEIEAVLGLWTWSLKAQSMDVENLPWTGEEPTSRFLLSLKDMQRASEEILGLEIWREGKGGSEIQKTWLKAQVSDIDATHHGGGFIDSQTNRQAHKPTMRCINNQNVKWELERDDHDGYQVIAKSNYPCPKYYIRQYFGWCSVMAEEGSQEKYLAVLKVDSEDSIFLHCAQEIYSTFLTAILNIVKDIGKISVTPRQKTLRGTASNENIKRIQQSLIARGLCDEEAAFACTIPILKRKGKLQLPDNILEVAGELADKHRSEEKWEELRELLNWMHHHSLADFDARHKDQNPAEEMKATNRLRLSVLELCATYYNALLLGGARTSEFGFEGILEMVERHSEEETYQNMPLVWRDWDQLPNFPNSQPSNVADTIRCYGEAALWHLRCKGGLDARQQYFQTELERHFTHQQWRTSGSLAQAMEKVDLTATFILLQRESPNEWEKTQALIRACQNGWFMVIKAISASVVAINQRDQHGRTALSYASELGDINAVRVLMRAGAIEGVRIDKEERMLPSHYAAKGGHAVIIKDIIAKWPETYDGEEDESGLTPLNWAITSGNVAAVRAFERKDLFAGRHMSNYSRYWRPPLHWAIHKRKADIVEALLESLNVDPNLSSTDSIKTPPLTCAVRLRDESIFDRILRSKRLDADTRDADGRSTIWWAAALGLHSYVRKLLESGKVYRPERPDNSGTTPLSIAAQRGHLEVVGELMKTRAGAAVSLETVLIAARNGHVAVVKVLLPRKVSSKGQARLILEKFGLHEILHEIRDSEFGVQPPGTRLRTDEIVEVLDNMDLTPKERKRWHDFEKELDSFTIFSD